MPIGVIAFFCFLIVGASGGKDKHFGLATGSHPHYMTDRMRPLPGKNWVYNKLPYVSPIPEHRPAELRASAVLLVSSKERLARARSLIKDDELTLKPQYTL